MFNLVLEENTIAEFTGMIVDIFEDYLEESNISLVNEERGEAIADGEENVAIIFGSDYDYISCPAENAGYNFLNGEFTTQESEDAIMEGFYNLLANSVSKAITISETDDKNMRESIQKVFSTWGMI